MADDEKVWSEDMGEISGMGGSYEAGCRAMVLAGMKWLDEHPEAQPQFHGYKGIYGVITEDNEDAKALTKAVLGAAFTDPTTGKATTVGEYGATGAMHQASIGHALAYRRLGWAEYRRQLLEREKAEAADGT